MMKYFQGTKKRAGYFEGWYLKHQDGGNVLSLIPAFHLDAYGRPAASIQVITKERAYVVNYPIYRFYAEERQFYIQIGKNVFSSEGCRLNIRTKNLTLKGTLHYGTMTPLKSDIMGPFQCVPCMQCNHGVISMSHKVRGSVKLNGEKIQFEQGTGYIEKDWGSSFPDVYFWTQCSWYEEGDCSVMLSIADIPFAGRSFLGCIGVVYYQGKEYRMATYKGVRIRRYTDRLVIVQQGKYTLVIQILDQDPADLQAPVNGDMKRIIKESLACRIRYRFYERRSLIFDVKSSRASLEQEL